MLLGKFVLFHLMFEIIFFSAGNNNDGPRGAVIKKLRRGSLWGSKGISTQIRSTVFRIVMRLRARLHIYIYIYV